MENKKINEQMNNLEKNETHARNLDWDRIFSKPINNIYEALLNQYKPSLEKVYKKWILEEYSNEISKVKDNANQGENFIQEIRKEKKERKINGKKVANAFILFFSFLLIGLPFLGFFGKNKKVINAFKQFKKEREEKISNIIKENSSILRPVFNSYTLSDWKDGVLKEMGINKVHNIKESDLNFFELGKSFYTFNYIKKYDIRNTYFYDILYSIEEWQNVVTSASVTKTVKTKDGWTTIIITAYHNEPTPFIVKKHSVNIPTNYLPELSFHSINNRLTQKQYNKMTKKGVFLLENPEFYQYFNYEYNDKIKFVTYFQVKTQELFIEFAKHFKGNINDLNKYGKNLYTSRIYDAQNMLGYSINHGWIDLLVDLDKTIINIDDIYQSIYYVLLNNLEPIFKSITMAYLNKNIASEDYNDDYYLSTYKDDKKYNQGNISVYEIINKGFFGKKYSTITKPSDKPCLYKISKIINDQNNPENLMIVFRIGSYWAENLIDTVYKSGEIINVPYVKYNPFFENKHLIFSPKYKTRKAGAFLAYNDPIKESCLNNSINVYSFKNSELLSYNKHALDDREEFLSNILLVQKIVSQFNENKNFSILFDNDGLFIFINEETKPNQIEKIFNLL